MINMSLIKVCAISLVLFLLIVIGLMISDNLIVSDFTIKNQPPSLQHFFGTDHLGRDVFIRTIKGLSTSLIIGLGASVLSSFIALAMGVSAGVLSRYVDSVISFIIDLTMSVPHLILLILISFCLGRGLEGIVVGLTLSHWTFLARVIRAECMALKEEQYVKMSEKFGKSKFFIIKNHIIPHIIPQFIIGTVLLFPHAILHESAVTFLGFGLPPESSAIGVMLSESLGHVQTGHWWFFLPGVCLVAVVLLFDALGSNFKSLLANDNHRI